MSKTEVYTGAALGQAAFNLRDPYYWQMADFVLDAASVRTQNFETIIDAAARIGITTMEALKRPDIKKIVAVEPDDSMRQMCKVNTMGDPRVTVMNSEADRLQEDIDKMQADVFFMSETIQNFHPPDGNSSIPKILENAYALLHPGGALAFNLGPSNHRFAIKVCDHRSGKINSDEIITELGHPLYQRAHAIALGIIQREFPDFERENLWSPAGAIIEFSWLQEQCGLAGLQDLEVNEILSPVPGFRVIEFIRNGWSVFFRWGQASNLPHEKKLALMNEVMNGLYSDPQFETMANQIAYHPTAVYTAIKI